jgi:hypothetical protein
MPRKCFKTGEDCFVPAYHDEGMHGLPQGNEGNPGMQRLP